MTETRMYLTVDKDRKTGGYIAVISRGQPQLGDTTCTVLDVTHVKSKKEAKAWYKRMCVERPWEPRQ